MEDGSIPDNKITASSTHSGHSKAAWGRLHFSQGSWTPNKDNVYQWFQVSFAPELKLITDIATSLVLLLPVLGYISTALNRDIFYWLLIGIDDTHS